MLIDTKCQNCPASRLRTPDQLKKICSWYELFQSELNHIKPIKVILLGESFPANRYFYDLDSNYEGSGLMYNLRTEFGLQTNIEIIMKFRELRVLVYDCAYCPLHLLESKTDQRQAATICLKNYKRHFLHQNPCPIITFFPAKRGFLRSELPEISSRITAEFKFSALHGIKEATEACIP
jgi:hypothetical protein